MTKARRAPILFVALATMLGAAPAPQPAATFPPHGSAYVTTLPAGASAWLDGTYVGQTPVYVDDLLPGRHSVTISRAGWQPMTASFDVAIGRPTAVSVAMQRQRIPPGATQIDRGQGTLQAVGAPSGSHIWVDGVAAGTLPMDVRQVEAGSHIVTVQPPAKGAPRAMRVVDVFPDSRTVVDFSAGATSAPPPKPGDEILEPLDAVVPNEDVIVSGDVVSIHVRGIEVECAIGARAYTFNGKAATLAVPPALVGGRIYLPRTLLDRLQGK